MWDVHSIAIYFHNLCDKDCACLTVSTNRIESLPDDEQIFVTTVVARLPTLVILIDPQVLDSKTFLFDSNFAKPVDLKNYPNIKREQYSFAATIVSKSWARSKSVRENADNLDLGLERADGKLELSTNGINRTTILLAVLYRIESLTAPISLVHLPLQPPQPHL